MEAAKFELWCILEIMGHQKYAGFVTEQALGGASFVRIDVPEINGHRAFTKLFGAGSIFGITPVSEEVARHVAASLHNEPVSVWDLRHTATAALPSQRADQAEDGDDDWSPVDDDEQMDP